MFKKMAVLAAGLFMSSAALAIPTISFDDGNVDQFGTVMWAGGTNPFQGVDIDINFITGLDTPANAGGFGLSCKGCTLNFETGTFLGFDGTTYAFGAGGGFTIEGEAFDGATGIANGVLLSGSFSEPSFFTEFFTTTGLFIGAGVDQKNADITNYFGITDVSDWQFAATTISIGTCSDVGAGFICDVNNADVDNIQQVPIPGTMALMPLGLLGLGLMRRKPSV